jgi:anti-anti-sigma regulatory factor
MSTPSHVNSTSRPTVRILGQLNKAVDDIDKLLASGVNELAIDFSTCTRVSVEGLEWLEELLLRSASSKAEVTLINIPPPIYKAFKVSRIDSIANACGSPSVLSSGQSVC